MKLEKKVETEIEALQPYNLEYSVRKWTRYGADWYWASPFEIYHSNTIWAGIRLSNGLPLGVKIESEASSMHPKLVINIFSQEDISNQEEKEALGRIIRCLGVQKDVFDFYEIAERHPTLRQAKEDRLGMRPTPLPDIHNALVLAITLQMASRGRTEKMIKSLFSNYGSKLEFDGKRVVICPTAKKIASIPEEELRVKCRLGYRAPVLKAGAHLVATKRVPDYEQLEKMPLEEAKNTLLEMRGIGEYSAEVMIFGIHPSFPVDSWSQKIFCQVLEMPRKASTEETLTALKDSAEHQFGEWRGYAFDYILNDFETLSEKFGFQL